LNLDKLNKNKAPSKGGKEKQSTKQRGKGKTKPEDPSPSQKHKNVKGGKKGQRKIMFQSPQHLLWSNLSPYDLHRQTKGGFDWPITQSAHGFQIAMCIFLAIPFRIITFMTQK